MGKREIVIGALLAALGIGGGAVVTGLSAETNVYTQYLLSVGWLAVAISTIGLAVMFRTAPKAALVAAHGAIAGPPPREFVGDDITTEVLRKKVEGRTSLQTEAITKTYTGKWKRLQGRVRDVSALMDKATFLQIRPDDDSGECARASIRLGPEWYDQAAALNLDDWVAVIGKIDRLNDLRLTEGEIVHMGEPPNPKPEPKPRAPRKKAAPKA